MSRYLGRYGEGMVLAALAVVALALPAHAQAVEADVSTTPELVASTVTPQRADEPPATSHPWLTPRVPAVQDSDDEGWTGSFAVYGFLTSIDGELRARDRVAEVDRSFGEIADVLKFAAAFRLEARHGPWGLAVDNNFMRVGDDVTTERGLIPDYRFDLALNITEIEPSYRIYATGAQEDPVGGHKLTVDVIGGVRIVHLSEDLEIRRLIGDDVFRDQTATYVHGYVGNRFVASPTRYLSLEGRYNVALASDFSWYLNGTAYIQPWEHLSFGAGLQVLDLSLENEEKDAAVDARFFGPVLSLRVHF